MTEAKVKPDAPITDPDLYLAFQLMRRKEFDSAENTIKRGMKRAKEKNDTSLEGIYFSALGVLYKLKKDYKKSYKYYQQAEKLLPDDPEVKIISSHLLIDEFKQYETALRKMQKVVLATTDPAILHHARAIAARASFSMGKKDQAEGYFREMLAEDFSKLRFAANLDFKMIELFVEKKIFIDLCKKYLEAALKLAKSKKESIYEVVINNLLMLIDLPNQPG